MGILIGADLVPSKTNEVLFIEGDSLTLLGDELLGIMKKADYRIFNLEVPLTDEETPIEKCGPNLIASTKTIKGYMSIGADILTLANNHIWDQGLQGLISTRKMLENGNIAYIGVGNTCEDAAKPYIFEYANKKVGIYACAEHEFSIVDNNKPGANPFDSLESPDHVEMLKKQCDYVIVLYHGGKEHYRYPSPYLQKVCRKFVDKGADLVVCQHSHCIGCEEKYKVGTIVYGQGNFLFDDSENECWNTSLLIKLDDNMNVSYIPLVRNGNTVRLASENDSAIILQGFTDRSKEIKQDGFVEKKYKEFADSMVEYYLLVMSGIKRNFMFKVFNKLSKGYFLKWLLKRKYTFDKKLVLQNVIECDAHRELLMAGLKGKSYV